MSPRVCLSFSCLLFHTPKRFLELYHSPFFSRVHTIVIVSVLFFLGWFFHFHHFSNYCIPYSFSSWLPGWTPPMVHFSGKQRALLSSVSCPRFWSIQHNAVNNWLISLSTAVCIFQYISQCHHWDHFLCSCLSQTIFCHDSVMVNDCTISHITVILGSSQGIVFPWTRIILTSTTWLWLR
jgi:hypothetical protein